MGELSQLNRAVDLLERNLAEEIDIEAAAREAGCSAWQFTRIFSYLSGMSVGEYVRARRLSLAAEEVMATPTSITDIAMKWGFGSHGAFDRAFKREFEATPSQMRSSGKRLKTFPRITFAISITGGESMEYDIRKCESLRIVGLPLVEGVPLHEGLVRKDGTNEIAAAWQDAAAQQKTLEVAKLIDGSAPVGLLQVSLSRNGEMDVLLGASTKSPAPSEWSVVEIPSATWAVFAEPGVEGTTLQESIPRLYHRIFAEWLPSSSWSLADLPQFEVYPQDWEKDGFEIWIPVEQ